VQRSLRSSAEKFEERKTRKTRKQETVKSDMMKDAYQQQNAEGKGGVAAD